MKSVDDRMKTVSDRYGKTLGASKGSKPLPKATVKAMPTKGGVKLTIKKKM